jgi:hypothetical protein
MDVAYRVYWSQQAGQWLESRHQDFKKDEMTKALKFMESLRARVREGSKISFITMSSEYPDSIGQQGVDVVNADYDWKKRRS